MHVLEFHGHRRACVKLQGKDAFAFGIGMIICQVHGRNTVDLMNLPIPDRNDGQFIPLVVSQLLFFVANFAHHLWLAVGSDDNLLKSFGYNATPLLGIQHAKELRLGVQIGLVTFDDKIAGVSHVFAAVLDPRIVARKTHFRFKDKVSDIAALPDQECVALGRLVFRCLPRDRAVFDGPEVGIA